MLDRLLLQRSSGDTEACISLDGLDGQDLDIALRVNELLSLSKSDADFAPHLDDMHEGMDAELMRDEIAALISELGRMSDAHGIGDIEHRLDIEIFEGPMRALATKVNEMVFGHIATKRMVIDQLRAFSEGNFDRPFPALPRQKAFVSDAIESLRVTFRGLVGELSRVTKMICDGHLDVRPDETRFSGDYRRILQDFSQLVGTLNNVFSTIGLQVSQSSAAVSQVSSAARELALNSQVQSTSVDEVSASAEETDTQVKANAAAAGQASHLVSGAATVAAEGKAKVGQMVQAMEGIRAGSQDIAKIIRVIDEIAFQTNLLALNAAVEAARAGQHGRGFAVVAQEVRNLAGRSAKAARETGELIESAGARVQAGVKIADETSRAFASIADDIGKVQDFMREIAVASDEQARGVAQINAAMSEVAKTALVTSQQADEVAARVAEIEEATARMRDEVSRFRLRTETATPAALPNLDTLPADLRAQIMALIAPGRRVPA
jgi:methyl-accepting chemotaxis protein